MKYENYKETGYAWFSHIPEHWHLLKNGVIFSKHQNKVGENYAEYDLLSLTTTGIKKKDINDVKGKVPASYEGYQEIHEGDIVFCLFDLDCSAVFSGLSKYNGMITSAYEALTPNVKIANPRFLDYWFQYVFFNRHYKMYSKSVRYTINYDIFKLIKTPLPPYSEQDQIVRYLDWQVSKINKLIAAKRKQIALSKERSQVLISDFVVHGLNKETVKKQSGVDWIGQIPENWEVLRCKYLFSERDERSKDGSETHLSMSQKYGLIPDSELDERRMLSASYAGGKLCYENDLVLNRLKAHLGVFALAPQLAVISPDYTVLIPNTKRIVPQYAEAVLKSDLCRRELRIRVRGIIEGFWRLYTEDFYTIKLPVPSIDEQKEIMAQVSIIQRQAKTFEAAIQKEIDVLSEMRNRLISDVVTGQIDVRSIEIPEYEYVADSSDEEESDDDEEVTELEQDE